jgi:hypothetical protein
MVRSLRRLVLELKFLGKPFIIIIQKSDPLTSGHSHSGIASTASSQTGGQHLNSQPRVIDLTQCLQCCFARSVYDGNHFNRIESLSEDTTHCPDNQVGPISCRNDHGYQRLSSFHI